MEKHTTPAPEGKSPSEPIDLELVAGDLSAAVAFIDAAKRFVHSAYAIASQSDGVACQCITTELSRADIILSEIDYRLERSEWTMDAFIEAVPASQLRIERKAA